PDHLLPQVYDGGGERMSPQASGRIDRSVERQSVANRLTTSTTAPCGMGTARTAKRAFPPLPTARAIDAAQVAGWTREANQSFARGGTIRSLGSSESP